MHRRLACSMLVLCLAAAPGLPALAAGDPAKAARFYESGLERFNQDDIPGAIIQLKNALQQDNRMLAAQLLLAKAFIRKGELAPAEVALRESMKLGVSASEVMQPLGRLYLDGGRPRELIERVRPDELVGDAKVEVITMRAVAYGQIGEPGESSRQFEQARALAPNSAAPLVAEVPVLLSLGKLQLAAERAERALQLAPDSADALNMHASVSHARGMLPEALAAYGKALQREPRHVDVRVARAALLVDMGRDREALEDLTVLKADGVVGEPRAAYLQAVLASRQGDNAAVRSALQDVVRLTDSVPLDWIVGREQMLMLGALAHYGLGDSQKIKDYLNILVSRYPRNLGSRKLMGRVYLDEGDPVRALSMVEEVLRSSPNDAQALFIAGEANLRMRRYQQATDLLERAAKHAEDDASVTSALGFAQLRGGRADFGIKTLEASFSRRQSDPAVGMTLATYYLQKGDKAKAVKVARALSAGNPRNPAALNLLGAVTAATGDLAGARKAYREALALAPDYLPAGLNLARLDAGEGRIREATDALRAMAVKNKDHPDVLYELGLLDARSGRYNEAIEWFEKARAKDGRKMRSALAIIDVMMETSRTAEAVELAASLAVAAREDVAVIEALGRAQLRASNAKSARQSFLDMSRLASRDAEAQLKAADWLLRAGFPEDAEFVAKKAIELRAEDLNARLVVGRTQIARGNLAGAEATIGEMRRIDPARAESFRLAGDLAMTQRKYADAARAYRRALDSQPRSEHLAALSRALTAGGDRAQAIRAVDEWLARHPDDPAARALAAELAISDSRLGPARQHLEKLLVIRSADVGAMNNLAMVLHELGDPGAEAMARKAHEIAPSSPSVADTLGVILVKAGKVDDGLRYLRDARLRAPNDIDVRLHLIDALISGGRLEEARAEWRQAESLGLDIGKLTRGAAIEAKLR